MASDAQVRIGVVLVGKAGSALREISGQVDGISAIVAALAAAAQEQSTTLGQVSSAVNRMDEATQHNAAMVRGSASAAHNLAGETENLAALVAHFHLEENLRQRPDAEIVSIGRKSVNAGSRETF